MALGLESTVILWNGNLRLVKDLQAGDVVFDKSGLPVSVESVKIQRFDSYTKIYHLGSARPLLISKEQRVFTSYDTNPKNVKNIGLDFLLSLKNIEFGFQESFTLEKEEDYVLLGFCAGRFLSRYSETGDIKTSSTELRTMPSLQRRHRVFDLFFNIVNKFNGNNFSVFLDSNKVYCESLVSTLEPSSNSQSPLNWVYNIKNILRLHLGVADDKIDFVTSKDIGNPIDLVVIKTSGDSLFVENIICSC